MSPVSIASQITGYQPQHTLPIHYGLHPNYVPTPWQQQNPYSRREHVPRSPLLDEFRMNKSRRWTLQVCPKISRHLAELQNIELIFYLGHCREHGRVLW